MTYPALRQDAPLFDQDVREGYAEKYDREHDGPDEQYFLYAALGAIDVAFAAEGGREARAALLEEHGGYQEDRNGDLRDVEYEADIHRKNDAFASDE
jgi:hypothetical protein